MTWNALSAPAFFVVSAPAIPLAVSAALVCMSWRRLFLCTMLPLTPVSNTILEGLNCIDPPTIRHVKW